MKLSSKTILFSIGTSLGLFLMAPAHGAEDHVVITPTTFDFGWAPDNAKLTAQFHVKNEGVGSLSLNAVQPSCGCTAADFTPTNIESNKDSQVSLTFDTHGYTGVNFNKTAQVRLGEPEVDHTVHLTGTVADSNAKVAPIGNGLISFSAQDKETKKSVEIQNKSDKEVTLSVIQSPADWISLKINNEKISVGKTSLIDVLLKGDVEGDKNTSATFEANDGTTTVRFTLAMVTGAMNQPYRKIRAPEPAASSTAEKAKPKTPAKASSPKTKKK